MIMSIVMQFLTMGSLFTLFKNQVVGHLISADILNVNFFFFFKQFGGWSIYEVVCYLWNLSEPSLFILGYLQMNRWRCCYVTQHCLGSPWPPNVMSDSPEGQPDFRLQQYLVAPMPHCTCSSQICIANSPLVDHNDGGNSSLLSVTDDVVFMVSSN